MNANIRRGMEADAEFLAWVMLAASRSHGERGFWDVVVAGDDARCLEYLRRLAVAAPGTLCHHDSFLVAEINGQPAAGLGTFHLAESGWPAVGHAMAKVQRDLGWTADEVETSRARLAPVLACMPSDAGADWCIEFVATLPQYRRRGLVDALMRQAIQRGVDRKCSLAQIQILIGNNPAQRAYEKAGFVVYDERQSPEFQAVMGSPGFRRLLRKL
jgi:ribosomal protein S18 acetylase RimI-like enzyme